MPEVIWKAYIGFEIQLGNRTAARALYERLLRRTSHVKVWMSYARFEGTKLRDLQQKDDDDQIDEEDVHEDEDEDEEEKEKRGAGAGGGEKGHLLPDNYVP